MTLIGTVHRFSSTSQFAVVSDWAVSVSVRVAWYARNGCRNIWFTSFRPVVPANDHTWFQSAPTVHGPVCFSATAVGPPLHLPVPRVGMLVDGRLTTGPTPQMIPPVFGEKKNDVST